MLEEYRAGLAAVPPEERGRYVAGWLRKTDDPRVLQHACAMAQTQFRAGDVDGFLEIVGGFLDAHPSAVESGSGQTWLAILGRYPYNGRRDDGDDGVALRYVTWIRDRIAGGDHPALLGALREFLEAISYSGSETVEVCLAAVQEGRYPEENVEVVRSIHREMLRATIGLGAAPRRERLARRGLMWHPEDVVLQRALVASLVDQNRHEEAVSLGTGWLGAEQTDINLLRSTIQAFDRAGHAPEGIQTFLQYGPGVTGDWEFPALLTEVLDLYRRGGRELDAISELEPFFEPPRSAEVTVAIAAILAKHGLVERALYFVRLAVETFGKQPTFDRRIFQGGEFESLRGSPEFEALLAWQG